MGTPVMIPFGRGNRLIKGYVIGVSDVPKWDPGKIKCIASIEKKGITTSEQLLQLAYWMKEKYGSTFNEAIKTVMPVKMKVKAVENRYIILAMEKEKARAVLNEYSMKKNAAARVRLLTDVIEKECVEFGDVKKRLNISMQTVNSLVSDGVVKLQNERIYRNPGELDENGGYIRTQKNIGALNAEQQNISDSIIRRWNNGDMRTGLIYGVTGSGKTEVYMSVIDNVIDAGRQVIMLIPEIALTYQTVNRFYNRYGDRVSILNSRMSAGERYDQYERAKKGLIDIIIGPRSALFVPFEKLGLIVVDEEHEDSYKSEKPPKYHAREVAEKRALLADAMVILGSATPSLESYYRSELPDDHSDKIIRYELHNRAMNNTLPIVSVVDLREEFKAKNYSIISRELRDRITGCLEKNEQIILFLNRRGYQGFVSCRSCGTVIKCPHCDVSLTIHNQGKNDQKMMCHYCGYEQEPVKSCPECGSPYIGGFRMGTQKAEEMIAKEFPGIRILRMDADTTTGKEGHSSILDRFARHEADLLIGTQMVVKGHDFPAVTLVGILAADMSLNVNEFRAFEKTFQLIVQAAGRAGRGDRQGHVVIQTYQPDNYAITMSASQDYDSFYEKEILYRRLMHYPPCSYMMTVFISAGDDETAGYAAKKAAAISERLIGSVSGNDIKEINMKGTVMNGPAPHSIWKLNDRYRYVIYYKSAYLQSLVKIREQIEDGLREECEEKDCIVDFDMQ